MTRFLAGAAAAFLLVTGAFFIWQGRAQAPQVLQTPPIPFTIQPGQALAPIPAAPSADPKSKEEKRFARADKDENDRITLPSWSSRVASRSPSSTSMVTAS